MNFNINSPTILGLGSGFLLMVIIVLLLFGLPIFFIWRKVFRKFIQRKRKRAIATWGITIISTPIILIGIVAAFISWMKYYPKYDFDKSKWANDKEERYSMSDNIVESKMLVGKTKAEVEELLGKDDNKENDNEWYYYLGFRPIIANIDPDGLIITFKNERVVSVAQLKK